METLIAIKTYSLDGPSCPLKEFKQYYRDILLFCNVVEIEKSVDRPWCRFRDVFALRAGDQVLPAAQDQLLTLGRLLFRADEVVDDRLDGAGLERGVVRSQAVESLQLVVEEGSHRGERFKRTQESCCFFVFLTWKTFYFRLCLNVSFADVKINCRIKNKWLWLLN